MKNKDKILSVVLTTLNVDKNLKMLLPKIKDFLDISVAKKFTCLAMTNLKDEFFKCFKTIY
jgi:hypothetical protein